MALLFWQRISTASLKSGATMSIIMSASSERSQAECQAAEASELQRRFAGSCRCRRIPMMQNVESAEPACV